MEEEESFKRAKIKAFRKLKFVISVTGRSTIPPLKLDPPILLYITKVLLQALQKELRKLHWTWVGSQFFVLIELLMYTLYLEY
ncbi:hypothetical protein GOP47_0008284 [Adiantum capillus-veneris]|uniref:Uncharacterized protein n=1 Tax=Adiantum capillus-veneris TaxID=13818 RepID=A0A9D4UY94_ADICA|nr:hypothetical protein GOP47_0008284 [Adiantum capillus-veneris]